MTTQKQIIKASRDCRKSDALTEDQAFDLLNCPSFQASNKGTADLYLFLNRQINQEFNY